jgi:hypothetical protein
LALPPFPCRRSTKRRGWPGACGLCPRYKERLPDLHAIDDETANPNNVRFVSSHIGSAFLRSIYLDDSYHMITSDNEREIVAREVGLFLRESEMAGSGGDGEAAPVVSRALASGRA